jgi:hypothetical protein
MKQCPFWEAKSTPASPEAPRILWNHKARYGVQKNPSIVFNVRHMKTLHALHSYFFKTKLPSTFRISKLSLSFEIPQQNRRALVGLSFTTQATSTPPPSFLAVINLTITIFGKG